MNNALSFKLKNLPHKPGCYLWKNNKNEIIYVGKAINLYKRCHQYFDKPHDYKTMRLIQDISDLDFIVVGTENEALILENQLIKKHRPKYNILLKDSQGYPYFVLTNHKHPQLKYTYFTNRYKGKYYGPLAAKTFEKKELKNLIDNLFPLRKCNQIPKKKCLYYDIGQCLGPCIKKIDLNVYDDIKKSINSFFTGKANNIIKQLKAKEQQAVKKLHFEEANRIKKTLSSIAEFKKYQTIDLNAKTNIDVLGFVSRDNLLFINLFTYINGKLIAKVQETYEYFFDLDDAITNWLIQYYLTNQNKPKILYINLPQKIIKQLNQIFGFKIMVPKKGKKKQILQNAIDNSYEYSKSNYLAYQVKCETRLVALEQLKMLLGIDCVDHIVAFDISNLFSANTVAGMISVVNGSFDKSSFRKYILDKDITSDYEAMKSVLTRYLTKNRDKLPDLIILDGGKIQVNVGLEICQKLGIHNCAIMGLVKNNKHQTNAIFYKNKTIKLDHKSPLYNFLANIQNKVHQYAISFFRKRHRKSFFA